MLMQNNKQESGGPKPCETAAFEVIVEHQDTQQAIVQPRSESTNYQPTAEQETVGGNI